MLKATREGLGEGLVHLGQINDQVLVLSADLGESTRANFFKDRFPDRFIDVGVAEQNLIGVAAGLAQEGFIPFCTSFAAFSPGRNWEQIKVSVCYNDANVKITSTHAGLTVGEDGATHQMLEDIALTRVLPNLTVISPCDAIEAKKAVIQAANHQGPVYLRFSREPSPIITQEQSDFRIGKANILKIGENLTIFSHGIMVSQCLEAASELRDLIDIEVINVSTIKPLDSKTILESVSKTKKAVVVEEAQVFGGLFGAIAEILSQYQPVPLLPIAIKDRFGESGQAFELINKYQLTTHDIIEQISNFIA